MSFKKVIPNFVNKPNPCVMKKLFYFTVFALFSCQSQQMDNAITQEDIDAIKEQTQNLVEAFKTNDYDKMSEIYADDLIAMPPNIPMNEGLENHLNWIKGIPGNIDGELTPVEIGGNKDLVYVRGTYDFSIVLDESNAVNDQGKYLELWKKDEAGKWRLFRDIWNPSVQEENKALILKVNDEIITKGNYDFIDEVFSADYAFSGNVVGLQFIKDFVSALSTAFPDLKISVKILAAEGDVVTWQRTHTATHKGEFMGIPATNKEITWRVWVLTRISDGQIIEEQGISDLRDQLAE